MDQHRSSSNQSSVPPTFASLFSNSKPQTDSQTTELINHLDQMFADPSKHLDLYQQYWHNMSSRVNDILECPYCSCKGEYGLIAIMHIPKCFEMYRRLMNTASNIPSCFNMNFQASNSMMTSLVPTAPVPLPAIPPRPTRNPPSKRVKIPAQNATVPPAIDQPLRQMNLTLMIPKYMSQCQWSILEL
jgi:hypothetical protein